MFSFRSPAGRLATGWLSRMQSEKRVRVNTFCADPDGGADSHGRRSVSSRWQWSRSHFVQTNNTAVSRSPPPRVHTDQEVAPETSPATNHNARTLTPPTAPPARPPRSPKYAKRPPRMDEQAAGRSCFYGNCWNMQQDVCAFKTTQMCKYKAYDRIKI